MSALKYPVLVWEDSDGCMTAALVEFPEVMSHAASLDEALVQLNELLSWQLEHAPWLVDVPDFLEPELWTVKVALQAEYRVSTDLAPGWGFDVPPWMGAPADRTPQQWSDAERRRRERVYPSSRPLTLRVAAVRGLQQSGLWACSLPMLGLRFYAQERDLLRDLAVHYVREALSKKTPQELTRFLPPKRVRLERIVVRVPERTRYREGAPMLDALQATSMPVGDSAFRRSFMRSFGRTRELDDLRGRLAEGRRSLLLVGPSGVGKTSLLVDAVASVERRRAEDGPRFRRRFWMTGAGRLVAGTRYLGQWQERCEAIVAQLEAIQGVLCVERLLDLVRLGGHGPADSIAAFLAPYVERGELRMVVEATPEEVDACRRLLPGFVDLFHVVGLDPFPAHAEAGVLGDVAVALTQQLHVPVGDRVADAVARLHRRFVPYAGFPGRPVSFLRGLMSERDGVQRPPEDPLTEAEVVETFSRQSGLPQVFLRDDMRLDEDEVRGWFRARVVGQEEACEAAVRLVMTFKAGLSDPERPLAVLLFCGPTGVGKTELARSMACWFFGREDERLVRLDMSEYAGWDAADRILGTTGGEPGTLIRRLRQQPFSLVLLDEIEKADPAVFDVLMGVFDEGRLKDAYGRVTTFRSAIVVMTSNLGAESLKSIGFTTRAEPSYEAEAMQFFRPEFFNRMDAVVRFQPLALEHVRTIAEKELASVGERDGLRAARIALRWTPALLERVVREGYDPRYGARPLQRAVESLVVTPVARWLAAHPEARDCTVVVDESGLRM